jgi:hypothetical protein
MKRTLRLSIGVLAGLGILVAGTLVLSRTVGTHEEMYDGKPAHYWAEQLTHHDTAVSNRVAGILSSQIIPHLTNQMFSDTNDSKLRMALVAHLNDLPGIDVHYADARSRRTRAAYDLGMFGPCAKGAAPALLEILDRKDDLLCSAAASALGRIQADPEAVIPALMKSLIDGKGHARTEVVEALGEYGPRAKAAVPVLEKLLKERGSKDLMKALPRALKEIGPEAAAAPGATK